MQITRIAPSPTGMFHLGTARTAYFNYLAAKSTDGKFILRIDDTDIERNKQEYTDIIIQSLEWLDLIPDEVYYQSKRIELYQKVAFDLLKAGKAKELYNGAIALTVPDQLPESFTDSVAGIIPITQTNKDQITKIILLRGQTISLEDDQVKIKDAGEKYHTPTYQFASVVDDYSLNINYIIRGVDHITNTPKQIAIWNQLRAIYEIEEADVILFPNTAHIGLIYKDKKKLSKRDDAASLLWYKEQGYSPAAILNFILRMGWGPSEDNKTNSIITKAQAIELFQCGRMRAAPSNYDSAKLNWYQKVHK